MYVITGATGNTGSVVANTLLAKGQKVRVIGRSAERLNALAAKGAEPFVAELSDPQALTKAFTGAKAAYVMFPPNLASPDVRGYQRHIADAVATAIEKAHVEHAVVLSSYGADKPDKTGPVLGLRDLEQRLNGIAGLNALHLRAGYFMENTLAQAGIIKKIGMAVGPVRADIMLPMIATRDIGAYAAEALLRLDFGKETRELLGQRDLSMAQAAAIIGAAVDRPGLQYRHLPDEQIRPALTQMGMSDNAAGLLLEMAAAINSGHMRPMETRTSRNTTPTPYETFVEEEFVRVFNEQSAAA